MMVTRRRQPANNKQAEPAKKILVDKRQLAGPARCKEWIVSIRGLLVAGTAPAEGEHPGPLMVRGFLNEGATGGAVGALPREGGGRG